MKRQPLLIFVMIFSFLLASCSPFSQGDVEQADDLITPVAAAVPTSPVVANQNANRSSPNDVVTITLAVSDLDQGLLQPVLQRFMAEYPQIRVQTLDSNISWDKAFAQNRDPEFFLRTAADVVSLPYDRVESTKHAESGYWRDLRPYIDADPSFDQTDFYTNTLEAVTFAQHTYLVPTTLSLSLLAYRKDVWTQQALPRPAPTWTWNDIQTLALRATENQHVQNADTRIYGYFDEAVGYYALAAELEAQGVDLQQTATTQFRLDNPAIVTALQHIVQLRKSGAVYFADSTIDFNEADHENQRKVAAGAFAIFPASWASRAKLDYPLGFAVNPIKNFAWRGMNGYALSAGSQHPEAAWQLISYLSRNEPASPVPFAINRVPARKSVAERLQYWQKLDSDAQQVVQATLNLVPPAYPVDDCARYQSWLADCRTACAAVRQTKCSANHRKRTGEF